MYNTPISEEGGGKAKRETSESLIFFVMEIALLSTETTTPQITTVQISALH